MLAYSGAPAPEGVWARIVDGLEETPPAFDLPLAPPAGTETTDAVDELANRRQRRNRPRVLIGAAAAAALVVGLVAGLIVDAGDSTAPPPDVAAASLEDLARRALNAEDSAQVELGSPLDPSLTATAAIEPDGSGYLLGNALPALDPAQTYQLWGLRQGVVVSLGVLGHSPRVVAFHTGPGTEALMITTEVAGGVPSSTNPPLLAGEVS